MTLLDAIRGAIITNGGTPTSFVETDAMRQLVTVYGGTPTQFNMIGLLREAIAAVGGTPTKFETYALIRELLEAMGETVTTYNPSDLLAQWAGAQSASLTHALAIGDSTVAPYGGYGGVLDSFVQTPFTKANIAVPGDTINGQQTKFLNNPARRTAAWVVIQVGLNDLSGSSTAAKIAQLQDLVDTVRSETPAGCRILISKMIPCRARLINLYGEVNGPIAHQRWLDMNDAIAGNGSAPIAGVDGRVTAHEPLLNDGAGNLAAAYDSGDGIHENNAGRQIVGQSWMDALELLGFEPGTSPLGWDTVNGINKHANVVISGGVDASVTPSGGPFGVRVPIAAASSTFIVEFEVMATTGGALYAGLDFGTFNYGNSTGLFSANNKLMIAYGSNVWYTSTGVGGAMTNNGATVGPPQIGDKLAVLYDEGTGETLFYHARGATQTLLGTGSLVLPNSYAAFAGNSGTAVRLNATGPFAVSAPGYGPYAT